MSTPDVSLPRPEPIRFYGTTWVDRSHGYLPRRFGLGLGAMLLAAAGIVLLRLAHDALRLADSNGLLNTLLIVAFALCSAMAFNRTWASYRRPVPGDEHMFRSIKIVGFVGVLLAYALRSGIEAPGEGLRRRHYEDAVAAHRKLNTKRSGNPARRARGKRPPKGPSTPGNGADAGTGAA